MKKIKELKVCGKDYIKYKKMIDNAHEILDKVYYFEVLKDKITKKNRSKK